MVETRTAGEALPPGCDSDLEAKVRRLFLVISMVVFSAPGMSAQAGAGREAGSVAGAWGLTLESPHGAIQFTLQLKQEGSKLSGTAEHEGQLHPLTGSVQKNQIGFSFQPRGDATLAFKGTVDGDKMSGAAEPSGARRQHGGERFVLSWRATRRT